MENLDYSQLFEHIPHWTLQHDVQLRNVLQQRLEKFLSNIAKMESLCAKIEDETELMFIQMENVYGRINLMKNTRFVEEIMEKPKFEPTALKKSECKDSSIREQLAMNAIKDALRVGFELLNDDGREKNFSFDSVNDFPKIGSKEFFSFLNVVPSSQHVQRNSRNQDNDILQSKTSSRFAPIFEQDKFIPQDPSNSSPIFNPHQRYVDSDSMSYDKLSFKPNTSPSPLSFQRQETSSKSSSINEFASPDFNSKSEQLKSFYKPETGLFLSSSCNPLESPLIPAFLKDGSNGNKVSLPETSQQFQKKASLKLSSDREITPDFKQNLSGSMFNRSLKKSLFSSSEDEAEPDLPTFMTSKKLADVVKNLGSEDTSSCKTVSKKLESSSVNLILPATPAKNSEDSMNVPHASVNQSENILSFQTSSVHSSKPVESSASDPSPPTISKQKSEFAQHLSQLISSKAANSNKKAVLSEKIVDRSDSFESNTSSIDVSTLKGRVQGSRARRLPSTLRSYSTASENDNVPKNESLPQPHVSQEANSSSDADTNLLLKNKAQPERTQDDVILKEEIGDVSALKRFGHIETQPAFPPKNNESANESQSIHKKFTINESDKSTFEEVAANLSKPSNSFFCQPRNPVDVGKTSQKAPPTKAKKKSIFVSSTSSDEDDPFFSNLMTKTKTFSHPTSMAASKIGCARESSSFSASLVRTEPTKKPLQKPAGKKNLFDDSDSDF